MLTESQIQELLADAGLARPGDPLGVERLAGGVSSEVYRVDLPGGPICLKRALPKLLVAASWEAPVERSHNEVLWLRRARAAGLRVPEILHEWPELSLFAMEYFAAEAHPVWKAALAAGDVDADFAAAVGDALGIVHRENSGSEEAARAFGDDAMFRALRIDPFLLQVGRRHPDLAERLDGIAERTLATKATLVHGDFSPKNILVGPHGPVILDAECAWYGDPAFDLAFCATHLLLKSVWKPQWSDRYSAAVAAFCNAYLAHVPAAAAPALEARAVDLVAALLIARVDGKSPVEYLTDAADRQFVVAAGRDFLTKPPATLAGLIGRWRSLKGKE